MVPGTARPPVSPSSVSCASHVGASPFGAWLGSPLPQAGFPWVRLGRHPLLPGELHTAKEAVAQGLCTALLETAMWLPNGVDTGSTCAARVRRTVARGAGAWNKLFLGSLALGTARSPVSPSSVSWESPNGARGTWRSLPLRRRAWFAAATGRDSHG